MVYIIYNPIFMSLYVRVNILILLMQYIYWTCFCLLHERYIKWNVISVSTFYSKCNIIVANLIITRRALAWIHLESNIIIFDMMYCNKYVCIISSIRQLTYKVTYTRQFLNNEWQCKLHRDKKDKDTIVSILIYRAFHLQYSS